AQSAVHRTLRGAGQAIPNGRSGPEAAPAFNPGFALAVMILLPARQAPGGPSVLGGPAGGGEAGKGGLLGGMMVQLINQKNAIRTTVYSDANGRYEFPKLDAGTYTLRIAQPREFRPYVKEKVEISGPTDLEEIVLSRITNAELLPHTPEIAAQMTGS